MLQRSENISAVNGAGDGSIPNFRLSFTWLTEIYRQNSFPQWVTIAYLFFEYVRPQSLYPVLDVFPFSAGILLVMVLLIPLTLAKEGFPGVGVSNWVFLMFFWILVSGLFAVNSAISFSEMYVPLNWLIVYVCIVLFFRDERSFFALTLAFMLFSLKMSQFALRSWISSGFSIEGSGVAGAPGWFRNSGEVGIQMCIFFPLAFYFFQWAKRGQTKLVCCVVALLPASACIAVLATNSRGAYFALGVVALTISLLEGLRPKILAAIGLAGTLGWVLLPDFVRERIAQAGTDETSLSRISYWKHGIQIGNEFPITGIGFNNWLTYYDFHYQPERWLELPHNFLIQAVSELGYVGLFFLAACILWCLIGLRRSIGSDANSSLNFLVKGTFGGLVGFCVSGFFVSVLYYPFLWIQLAFGAALIGISRSRLR